MRTRLSEEQRQELEALAAMPEDAVDTSDIPEVLDWSGATRGMRPRRRPVEFHIEARLLDWFEQRGMSKQDVDDTINRLIAAHISKSPAEAEAV
jgi:uncharacterized protein (DUF4415 family)